jgi:GT2 family glycosyltransferase
MTTYLNKPKIAAIILFMPKELRPTLMCVESILNSSYENLDLYILQNGASSSNDISYKVEFDGFDRVNFFYSEVNLGVAGGRNLLMEEISDTTEFISILDNDLIITKNYFDKMVKNYKPQCGILGSVVLDYRKFLVTPYFLKFLKSNSKIFPYYFDIADEDISDFINESSHAIQRSQLFHTGVNPDVKLAYFSPLNRIFGKFICKVKRRLGQSDEREVELRDSRVHRAKINKNELVQASNIAGCCQFFSKSILDTVGFYDNQFNPYGYEDVDFSLRVIDSGLKNYTVMDSFLVHGTDDRHRKRNPSAEHLYVKYRAFSRMISKHVASEKYRLAILSSVKIRVALDFIFSPKVILKLKRRIKIINKAFVEK